MAGKKGDETKERILEESLKLFQRKGMGGTSLSDILAATGLKKGALYFHFTSKEEIALLALERARSELLGFLDSSLTGQTPAARLDNHFSALLEMHRKLCFAGGCIFGNVALEMADSNDRIASIVCGVFDEWTERIRGTVEAGVSEGVFRSDLSAADMALHVVAATEGAIMLARLQKSDAPLTVCFSALRLLLAPPVDDGVFQPAPDFGEAP